MNTKKLILYIACSVDGYIAQPGDDLSFLDKVQREGEDYGYTDFTATVDTVIMGRRTYDWIMARCPEYVHHDKNTYIITRTERPQQGNTRFYTGDLKELVATLKSQGGKNIFCDGGAEIVNELLKDRLFDELIISIIPVLLGDGTRLFRNGVPMQDLILISSKSFDSGLVQLHYKVN
ncbi:dihydrofolate reductase family protein [Elizabethkingia meningoseptica]|uniref:dihydrofolate reductase family protein n=1 Tax=Elizabethkingia meningoseptica TaxID=238 RepID=UPI000999DDFB|nr:dihydrofolate reductase family protein [Elizabethkingia meningoseptica]MCL1674457.1 dihydrofolate reductase family protein [Elizabethkingia meningoseptica]MCL1687331.1 dihydrofolate reductase family protein [Elizabethkingia meningoseptica]MDE5490979.1 dihydrofolate reductase family protein [Elizabethkingia meningoseptica]OPB95175.1 dihydrofolate reductase [Elizabethkingia meningoseptica]